GVLQPMNKWEIPATEVNRCRHRRNDDHRRILGHEEQRPTHTRIFSMKTCDKLRLRFRKIEWRAIVLRDAANQKHQESRRLVDDEPARIRSLGGDDAGK